MKQPASFSVRVSVLFAAGCILLSGCAQQPSSSPEPLSSVEPIFSSCDSVVSSDSSLAESIPDLPASTTSGSSETQPPASSKADPIRPDSSQPDIPPSAPVAQNFFDDAVFIGDSVSLKLKYYVMNQRKKGGSSLGEAQFLVSGSLGSGNALMPVTSDSVHPAFQGNKMPLDDSISKAGVNKVFLMLGMNDIGIYGVDKAMGNLDTLIQSIQKKSPQVAIYLQSVTPMFNGMEKSKLNNASITEYNARLNAYCSAQGFTYVDIASKMKGQDGSLRAEYCSDPDNMGIHFTDLACSVWVDCLNTLA